jgi:hypothetical protein
VNKAGLQDDEKEKDASSLAEVVSQNAATLKDQKCLKVCGFLIRSDCRIQQNCNI